jgi:fructokinase
MIDVLALGELLIDFTTINSDEDGYPTMAAHPGGAPANFLAALTKFGYKTALLGKVGNDAFGKMLTNTLEKAGINKDGIVVDSSVFTTLAFVTLDESGDREFSFARKPGADTCITFDEINKELLDETKVFHFGTLSLTSDPSKTATEKAVAYCKERNKLITFDPNYREPLWKCPEDAIEAIKWGASQADIMKISLEEVELAFGLKEVEGAKLLLDEYGVDLVFVTLGKDGCYFANKNACGYVENYNNVHPVDTTGAGDIFGGSAVSRVLEIGKAPSELNEDELRYIAGFACTSAALSTECYGGIQSVQELETVKNAFENK